MTEREATLYAAMVRRGVPQRTAKVFLRGVRNDTEAVQSVTGAKEDLVVLSGPPGVGKSVAACVWLCSQARERSECMFWTQAGSLARGSFYDRDVFEQLAGVYALVIDDLGVEYLDQKDRYLASIEEILSVRYARERKTLLTTNATAEAFRARYGERVASRINEDGAFIVCGGHDLRRASVTTKETA